MARSWREVRSGRQYVNVSALQGGKVIKDTLEKVKAGQYQGKPQVIGSLRDSKMNVAINTTSCNLLEARYGEDMDGWEGKKVTIKLGKAQFGNSKVDAIIVAPDGK